MGPQLFLFVGLFLQLLSAHQLHPRDNPACEFSVAASYAGETCDTFTRRWHIDRATFLSLNPDADCSALTDDRTFCVKEKRPSISASSLATISTTTASPTIGSTTTDSSTATSSTATDNSTVISSTATGSSTATRKSTTPTASSESTASAATIPLQITMIVTLLLSVCFT
ncbi:hypothetical protein BDV37DRAFT_281284 [Aspergillus pseudonomiae]|uniref:LysM domain-containing protein n=1 Tax=Aspergillus pseudonomiae TaxID=1506151 RepID=A0A5N7DHW0_9EURO|nr:uncharacterized protein BDV37DRAFT_281284 [Aspergillus pseudonomiae]KAE8406042.1 hypothetical protein BDV37DRAFT_281284 [Aspergillus pseudonomiae]